MSFDYDLLVIGTGVSGRSVVQACSGSGMKIAVADNRAFGGTCQLRGCHPKKVLAGAAEIIYRYNHMKGKGADGKIEINWPELMNFKKSFTDPVPSKTEKTFIEMGIDSFHGTAVFTGKNSMRINQREISARYIVLATGASPRKLDIPGEKYILSSDQFLQLDSLPERIIFIGGGYISFEFAHIASRAGAQVKILSADQRPLVKFDSSIVGKLVETSNEIGIAVYNSSRVVGIEKTANRLIVQTMNRTFEAEMAVHGAGRVPDIDSLDLSKGDVAVDGQKLLVNEYLQSVTNTSVYIAGDVHSGGVPLTPVGVMEGLMVAENLLHGNSQKPDYTAIPSVVFTLPKMASAGTTEEQARKLNLNIDVHFQDTSTWMFSRNLGLSSSAYKLIIDKKTKKILGAHLLGHNCDEVINIFSMAIKLGLTTDDLKKMVWTYPTLTSDIVYMLQGW